MPTLASKEQQSHQFRSQRRACHTVWPGRGCTCVRSVFSRWNFMSGYIGIITSAISVLLPKLPCSNTSICISALRLSTCQPTQLSQQCSKQWQDGKQGRKSCSERRHPWKRRWGREESQEYDDGNLIGCDKGHLHCHLLIQLNFRCCCDNRLSPDLQMLLVAH